MFSNLTKHDLVCVQSCPLLYKQCQEMGTIRAAIVRFVHKQNEWQDIGYDGIFWL